jgi:hypothetical protein
MTGRITSVEQDGPKRNLRLVISETEVFSQISSPAGSIPPHTIDHYELSGLQTQDTGLVTLTLVLTDGQRVRFYSTDSKFDMVLLLDQLDGTIGGRKREISHVAS